MHRPRPFPPISAVVPILLLLAMLLGPLASGASGQQPDSGERLRIGITMGGISLMGLSVEYRWNDRSVDLTIGTWALQDVSVSVVAKQYLGPGGLRPFFGLGLWGVVAFPAEGTGSALVLRAPIGVDWQVVRDHFLGAAMNINRGLWVRRVDPADETPLNQRLVPLPGFYYRWEGS